MLLVWTSTFDPIHQEKKRDLRRQRTQSTGCLEHSMVCVVYQGECERFGTSGKSV